jgi:hypothetical protein
MTAFPSAETLRLALGNGRNGATLAVSRRLGHRQLGADSGRSGDPMEPRKSDPKLPFEFYSAMAHLSADQLGVR